MYRQHRLCEIGLRRGVSRDKNGLRRGLAGLNRTWTFDPCTPCLKFCTPTFKILPNSLSDSFSRLFNCRPSKTPQVPPCVSRGYLFGVYPFPYESAHVCHIWCQSAQPFGSFSRMCAKVSSTFRRCTRDSRKNTPKNNIYTSKIIIPARTCRHQRH